MERGQTHTHTDKQTCRQINIMTRTGLRAGPSENGLSHNYLHEVTHLIANIPLANPTPFEYNKLLKMGQNCKKIHFVAQRAKKKPLPKPLQELEEGPHSGMYLFSNLQSE